MKKIFALLLTALCINSTHSQCTSLFFSEYIEGSSNNKALEIYNPTTAAIDLDSFTVVRFNNGGTNASGTLNFPTGTMIAAGDVYVIGNSSAITGITSVSDITNAITFFNGDDAIVLYNNIALDTLDAIGEIGVDPGTNWTVGTGATSEFTLVRKNNITQGTKDWAVGITKWDAFPQNTTDSLGTHSTIPCAPPCPNTSSSFSVTECTTYTVPSGDETYNTPSTVTVADTISNHCGSDSIMAITVTILPAKTGTVTETICAGDSIIVNGNTYKTTVTGVLDTVNNIGPNNCDSVVTINLTVTNIDITVANSGATLTANQAGATYKWLDCDDGNAVIPSETGVSFTATASGNYAVEITVGNCVDTSACENIIITGINEIENNNISIFPNPTKNIVTIDFSKINGDVNFTLTSVEGRIIKQQQNVTEQTISIDLSNESKGIYLLKVDNNSSVNVYKIVRK